MGVVLRGKAAIPGCRLGEMFIRGKGQISSLRQGGYPVLASIRLQAECWTTCVEGTKS